MTNWILMFYSVALATPIPIGTYKTEAGCREAVVSIKFDYAERHGFDGMPELTCVRVKRQPNS
jgi:hypothetical protein